MHLQESGPRVDSYLPHPGETCQNVEEAKRFSFYRELLDLPVLLRDPWQVLDGLFQGR